VIATVSADFAVSAMLAGTAPSHLEQVTHSGALPDLGKFKINMYMTDARKGPVLQKLADLLRTAYQAPQMALTA